MPNNARKLLKAPHLHGNGRLRGKGFVFCRGFFPWKHREFLLPLWMARQRCQARAGTENRHAPEKPQNLMAFIKSQLSFLCKSRCEVLGAQLAAEFGGKGIKLIKVFAKILLPPAGHLSLCHNGEAMMGLRYLPSIPPALGFKDQILTQKRGWGSLVI